MSSSHTVCTKHRENPVKGYHACAGCEVAALRTEKERLETQLVLVEKAFELATKNGLSYSVEGWGGRYKTKHVGADEYRLSLLSRAGESVVKD